MRYAVVLILNFLLPAPAMGASVTFNWSPPSTSCDGSALSDLFGYAILWGTNSGGPYLNQHNVDDPGATSVTINVGSVENQTLYFVAVSVDSSGNRSDDVGGCGTSNEVAQYFGPVPPSPPRGLVAAQ
ncbi:MAG: hypothetical protein JSV00_02250 [bacterium]|nr:MAG: hypothetical protein JSV00_02250 [bacterium]